MQSSKNIVLLCLFDELSKNNKLNPKEIVQKYNINNRQMWIYIKNLKEYYSTYTNKILIYDTSNKKYYFYYWCR